MPRLDVAAAAPKQDAPPRPPLPSEPAPESARGSSPSGPPSAGRRARPAAPPFKFSSPADAHEPTPPAAPVAVQEARPAAVICTECRSSNPPEYRFCVVCGTSLKRAATDGAAQAQAPKPAAAAPAAARAPRPAAPEPAEPRPAVPRPAPADPVPAPRAAAPRPAPADEPRPAPRLAADDDRIIGAPVVDIASSGAVPARLVTCPRCQGHSVAGTRFCKYCGAPLDESQARRGLTPADGSAAAPVAPAAAGPAPRPAADPVPPPAPSEPKRTPDQVGRVPLAPIGGATANAPAPVQAKPAVTPAPPKGGTVPIPVKPVAAPAAPAAPAPPPAPPQGAAGLRLAPREPEPPPPVEPPLPPRPPFAPPRVEPVVKDGEAEIRSSAVSALAGSPIPAEPVELPQRTATGRWRGGRLVVIVEDGSEGKSFSLAEGQLDIGRTEGDIVLEDDPYVSPRHARLRRLDGSWLLRDLDSTNHVYVRLRKPYPLRDADLLLLGLEVLQFQTVSDGERGLGHAIQHGTHLFGSPPLPRRARLCQRTVEGVIRDVYHLFRDETVIGREVGDIVFTADPFLSRKHAAIRRSAVTSEFSLVDLESSNGTYVAIRGEIPITDGDFLRIGQHLFRVDLG
jgi:pSer/pThr/pTyr-binding forkhead associated (FHA) protein